MKKKIYVFIQCFLLIIVISGNSIVRAANLSTTENNVFKLLLGQSLTKI